MSGKCLIEDIGEYIPLARKDAYEHPKSVPLQSSKNIELKNLWPEPEWESLFNNGIPSDVLALIYAQYHYLLKRPIHVDGWKVYGEYVTSKMWECAYIEVVDFIRRGCENVVTIENMNELKNEFTELYGNTYKKYAAGVMNRKRCRSSISLDGFYFFFPELLPKLGWPLEINAKKIPHVPMKVTNRETSEEYFILASPKKGGGARYKTAGLPYTNKFRFYDDAVSALIQYHGGVFSRMKSQSVVYVPRKDSKLTEQGECVTRRDAHELMRDFDFRGVQFGNCLSQTERQRFIDNTYQALSLLASILNIPSKWIGNRLGIAFAARGRGTSSAHYEQGLNTINLTRLNGIGCIAHEFFHSFDSRMALRWLGEKRKLMSEVVVQHQSYADDAIEAAHRVRYYAFKRIVDACVLESEFTRNAKRLSGQKRGKKYWDAEIELCARAFEAYIQDVAIAKGEDSAWLAFGTLESDYPLNGMHPYPTGTDRVRISKAMKENLPVLFQK